MTKTSKFNIIRKHRGDVSIFKRELDRQDAVRELKHLKNLARNSGGRVYFDMVEVPYELTEDGKAEAAERAAVAADKAREQRHAAVRQAVIDYCEHTPDPEDGFCEGCMSIVQRNAEEAQGERTAA